MQHLSTAMNTGSHRFIHRLEKSMTEVMFRFFKYAVHVETLNHIIRIVSHSRAAALHISILAFRFLWQNYLSITSGVHMDTL